MSKGKCFFVLVTGLFISAFFIIISFAYTRDYYRNHTSVTETVTTEAIVVEKTSSTRMVYYGTALMPVYSYSLTVVVDGNDDTTKISVPATVYGSINKNDAVMVDVALDKDGNVVTIALKE